MGINMSNIALFGIGRMGRAIAHMIKKLGNHTIYSWDIHNESYEECEGHISCDIQSMDKIEDGFDLAISSLPYHLNYHIAKLCIDNRIPYCDLGGSIPVGQKINSLARASGATVFTDLGLAPGWANILAEEALQKLPSIPNAINMRCGGLPVETVRAETDPFNYFLTWSSEGLYNEYTDTSQLLQDNLIIFVPSLCEREIVMIDNFPELEAFTTSGGASHTLRSMQHRGVRNCSYKTLRYKGHLDLIQYFIRTKKFSAEQLSNLFCDPTQSSRSNDDVVIVEVEALSSNITYRKTQIVDAKGGYSAMQRATAGGLVAGIFASPLDHGSPLSYANIDIDTFNNNIKSLNIVRTEQQSC